MVCPYQERQDGDRKQRNDHREVSEDRFACIHTHHLRNHAHGWEQDDIYFGVTKEPEQVLEQDGTTSFVGKDLSFHHDVRKIEAGAEVPVEQQQNRARQQHRETQYT